MLICNNCKNVFEETKTIEDDEVGPTYVCPCCHEADFEELDTCILCNEPIVKDRHHRRDICLDCENAIRNQLRDYVYKPMSTKYGIAYQDCEDAILAVLSGDK